MAGVSVKLQVRGMCCLRPGVEGLSENIIVTSLVGRFLEHSRMLYFQNGGEAELFIGSADLMPRNLDRRIEVLVPVLDPALRKTLLAIMRIHFSDNCKTHRLLPDGSYVKLKPGKNPVDSQAMMLNREFDWHNVSTEK
jgi:polyphosphate kinase